MRSRTYPSGGRWWRGRRRPGTCSSTRSASAARRSTWWRCTRPSLSHLDEAQLAAVADADYVTFTSSSTVRFFFESAGRGAGWRPRARLVSIGPVTSATLREHGLEPDVEASRHDIDGVVDALIRDATASVSR